ncbi:MAG TPA: hypothetical protein VHE30_29460 [Polyangiaceae bacterium]|nr:hypothetical protein [Polyangiaceae bacterium]
MSGTEVEPVRQAREALNGKLVTVVVIGTAVATALCAAIAAALLGRFRPPEVEPAPYPVAREVGGIHQTLIDGRGDAEELGSRARTALDQYRFVTPDRSIATIPIERAFEWLEEDSRQGRLVTPDPATTPDASAPTGAPR